MADAILSIGILPDWVKQAFAPPYRIVCVDESSREGVLGVLDESFVAIIARGTVFIDAEIMDLCPHLKVVARTGVGYDSVCIEDASERKIPVTYTPGAMTSAVGEHALALILAAYKRLPVWRDRLMADDWNARYHLMSLDLNEATLGIVGYGRIGRHLRQMCRSLGPTVLADDPYIDHSLYAPDCVTFVSLEELLEQSDIVSLHVPLTEETRGLINRRNFSLIRPGTVLINTARGAVVESLDLLHEGLVAERLSAVGLDVFPEEPPDTGHPIFQHPGAILTGHVAARTPAAQKGILESMVKEVSAILAGSRPDLEMVVNPDVYGCPRSSPA